MHPWRHAEPLKGNEESLPTSATVPAAISVFEASKVRKPLMSEGLPASKLSFGGVSNKKNCHTGYFQYRVGEDGRIYCRWDPVIAREPFRISCSNRRELPWRLLDGSPREIQKLLSRIVGPYTFLYEASTSTVLVTPRADLDNKGFVLRNGKLVEVPIAQATQWHLHDGTGGPKLAGGVKIEEIQVANETIFARGSDNLMYLYSPGVKRRDRKAIWETCYGFFDKGIIRFPENMRDWASGVSVQMKPWQRRGLHFTNPWTDADSYFGQGDYKIAQGATITLGVIPEHGRTVQLWDTGLPSDLHRGFLTPERGRFLAEKVGQAGSVWVVLGYDSDGFPAMYWRKENYEGSGACIGMEHACNSAENVQAPSPCVRDLGEAIRLIPDPGWSKIEFPKLTHPAVITDLFSVHCTGEGETTREIRFEGKNGKNEIGFYFMGLNETSWHFKRTEETRLLGNLVRLGIADPEKATPYKISRDYESDCAWSGLKNAPIASVSLLDFHPYQTQSEESVLRFTLASSKTIDVYFRTADAWSPFKRERFEDEAVGQGAGVAKMLVGTLDIPEAILQSGDEEICDFVNAYLKPYHHIPNLFEVIADIEHVEIKTSGQVRRYRHDQHPLQLPPCSFSFSRDATGETLFELRAQSPNLSPSPSMSALELQALIRENEAFGVSVGFFQKAVRSNGRRLARRWRNVEALLIAVRAFTLVVSIRDRPYVGAVLDLTPRLISVHRRGFKRAKDARLVPQGIQRALRQVEHNIAEAKKLLEQ
jgi:hypothetical protein